MNLRGRLRWNAAFAYLDPVRRRPNLTIIDRTLVDRVEFSGRRAVGVAAIRDGVRIRLNAGMLVLAAGAYATPAILLRSGVGPSRDLRESDVPVVHDLPGVGQHLLDHPYVTLSYAATEALEAANVRHLSRTALFAVGQYKGRSSRCDPEAGTSRFRPGAAAFRRSRRRGGMAGMNPIAMKTISTGTVRLRSRDPRGVARDRSRVPHGSRRP